MTPANPTKKIQYNVKLDPALLRELRTIKARDGVPESEQIRRGIRLWLAQYRRRRGGRP